MPIIRKIAKIAFAGTPFKRWSCKIVCQALPERTPPETSWRGSPRTSSPWTRSSRLPTSSLRFFWSGFVYPTTQASLTLQRCWRLFVKMSMKRQQKFWRRSRRERGKNAKRDSASKINQKSQTTSRTEQKSTKHLDWECDILVRKRTWNNSLNMCFKHKDSLKDNHWFFPLMLMNWDFFKYFYLYFWDILSDGSEPQKNNIPVDTLLIWNVQCAIVQCACSRTENQPILGLTPCLGNSLWQLWAASLPITFCWLIWNVQCACSSTENWPFLGLSSCTHFHNFTLCWLIWNVQ